MSAETDTKPAKLNPTIQSDLIRFDRDECQKLGKSLQEKYTSNSPFPHIVLDDFLPKDLLRRVLADFPKREPGKFSDAHSRLKTGYQLEKIESPFITNLIDALNSSQFMEFLEEMTGIKGLFPDPHQTGGGLHETARGGHLSIHADFNLHPKLRAHRRMNLILFLNEGWQESYGGALELWKTDMSACEKAVLPVIGRAVVFNTNSDSYHGHPDPLNCPDEVFRRSLALYYYSVPEDAHMIKEHTTLFQVRPGSPDERQRADWHRLARDFLPPVLYRLLRK